MEAFWHSAGLEMGNRCGGGSRRWFWRRVSSPGEVPVGVFWLDSVWQKTPDFQSVAGIARAFARFRMLDFG